MPNDSTFVSGKLCFKMCLWNYDDGCLAKSIEETFINFIHLAVCLIKVNLVLVLESNERVEKRGLEMQTQSVAEHWVFLFSLAIRMSIMICTEKLAQQKGKKWYKWYKGKVKQLTP